MRLQSLLLNSCNIYYPPYGYWHVILLDWNFSCGNKSIRKSFSFPRQRFLKAHLLSGVSALRDVAVMIPAAAKIMDTVTLQCKYDLEGELLYTVKWYKGQKEFFRYIPKEMPSTQVFPLPGIDVDVSIFFVFIWVAGFFWRWRELNFKFILYVSDIVRGIVVLNLDV